MQLLTIGPLILLLYFSIIVFLPYVGYTDPRPNIILILADDMGRNDLSIYGSADARTPQLDLLANSGIRFDAFYAQPVCTPSRYSLLTGFDPQRAPDPEMMGAILWSERHVGLRSQEQTLAETLKAVGYRTAMIGKWHLGHGDMVARDPQQAAPDSEFHPNNHGFDYFFGLLSGAIDYNTHWNQNRWPDWFENKTDLRDSHAGEYATRVFTRKAVEYIEANANGTAPFFLYVPYNAPHYAQTVDTSPLARNQLPLGEEQDRRYLSRFDDLYSTDDNIRKRYLSMVAIMDDGVGQILRTLSENGIRNRTIVIFVTDNGGETRYGGSNRPLRGRKATLYEGGIRVPAIISWPSVIPAGVTTPQLAQITDLYPTLLSMIGIDPSEHQTDGIDLAPTLKLGAIIERDVYIANCYYGHVYRQNEWKYLRTLAGEEFLYNLHLNPGESLDLAQQYPDQLAWLRANHTRAYGANPCP